MRLASLLGAALLFTAPALAFAQDAAGNAEAGQRVFNQCRACHTINQGGRNGVGPNLWGVWERQAGSIEGFRYSAPMRERAASLKWDEATLRAYLTDPKAVVPGGSMAFPGIRNPEQLTDLIAYLRAQR
jgi:cytochrome c